LAASYDGDASPAARASLIGPASAARASARPSRAIAPPPSPCASSAPAGSSSPTPPASSPLPDGAAVTVAHAGDQGGDLPRSSAQDALLGQARDLLVAETEHVLQDGGGMLAEIGGRARQDRRGAGDAHAAYFERHRPEV